MWTYFAGFRPQAYGTEKFMDYGFMEAMMRSTTLPARDLWYSEGTINYYYGGQYFAVFLTKLTGSKVELTYNLMRTFVAAFAFVLPFSLVRQMSVDRLKGSLTGKKRCVPAVAGIIAGLSVSIAGNMHYVVYSKIIPWLQNLQGKEADSYWFPDATRYIGYNPDVPDKTIHEFPCYSFVLEKTAVDSAYPAGCSDDRYVPVYEFLGFYYLFRGDRWSGAVYQYRSV